MESAHSGLSGSKYDVLTERCLSSRVQALADTVVEQRRAIDSSAAVIVPGAEREAFEVATTRLEKMLHERDALPSVTSTRNPTVDDALGVTVENCHDPSLSVTGQQGKASAAASHETGETSHSAESAYTAPHEHVLDTEHIEILEAIFAFLDSNADGLLDEHETRVMLASMGLPPTVALLDTFNAEAGSSGSKGISCQQFRKALETHSRSHPVSLDAARDMMSFFDGHIDGVAAAATRPTRGFTPTSGLRRLLVGFPTVFGTQISHLDYEQLMESFGISDGDIVDGPEFVRAMTSGFLAVQPLSDRQSKAGAALRSTFGRTASTVMVDAATRAADDAARAAAYWRGSIDMRSAPFAVDDEDGGGLLPPPSLAPAIH